MRPKFIVYCLAAICLAFAGKGLILTENIQNTLKENARQSESSIMEIGMCFDWYGVIIVNSVIKTSHGVITPAEMVETLEKAGANLFGKLNLHEFAYGATGENNVYGTPINVFDRSRLAGGSSSGSAAAHYAFVHSQPECNAHLS